MRLEIFKYYIFVKHIILLLEKKIKIKIYIIYYILFIFKSKLQKLTVTIIFKYIYRELIYVHILYFFS